MDWIDIVDNDLQLDAKNWNHIACSIVDEFDCSQIVHCQIVHWTTEIWILLVALVGLAMKPKYYLHLCSGLFDLAWNKVLNIRYW